MQPHNRRIRATDCCQEAVHFTRSNSKFRATASGSDVFVMSTALARIHSQEYRLAFKGFGPVLKWIEAVDSDEYASFESVLILLFRRKVWREKDSLWVDFGEEVLDVLEFARRDALKA